MRRFLLGLFFFCCTSTAYAQDTLAVAADTAPERFPPGKALMRSLLLPGWGQFSVGAPKRGAFFVAIQGTSYYMLARTFSRLGDARDHEQEQVEIARDSIEALPPLINDTIDIELRIDSVPRVIGARSLVRSRERQRQDWITYALFFTLASGVDAFVAAHLADFPAAVDVTRRSDGASQIQLNVPLPSRRLR